MLAPGMYTTQLQAGLGLIEETRLLLSLWHEGANATELYRLALNSGTFPNISARRLRNIVVEGFAPRYLGPDGTPADSLKCLAASLSSAELSQLFFLYTCRANQIFADFVRAVYWERYAAGDSLLSAEDALQFVRQATGSGRTEKIWAESTIKRVSSYLMGCCADFGLLGQRSSAGRRMAAWRIETKVGGFLAHELHFQGLADNANLSHPDWQLFGLTPGDTREEFKRLSLRGYFILQSAGEVTRIGWKYKSMEGFIGVLAQG